MSTAVLSPNRKLVRDKLKTIKQRIEQDREENPDRNPANIIDVTDIIDDQDNFLDNTDNASALNRLLSAGRWKLREINNEGDHYWVIARN